ncbi:MAG: hypothetical protein J6C55_02280, partial [Oscillospiraceae bacterium]|nr:hypothetical protein [Oscillospiraceae bacterium]
MYFIKKLNNLKNNLNFNLPKFGTGGGTRRYKYIIFYIIFLISISIRSFGILDTEIIDGKTYYKINNKDNLKEFAQIVNGEGKYEDSADPSANAILTKDIEFNKDNDDPAKLEDWHEYGKDYAAWLKNGAEGDKEPDEPKSKPGEEWTPIGDTTYGYEGIFDGNGFSLNGLYCNVANYSVGGLFSSVGMNGVVKNLGIKNAYVSGGNHTGGLTGRSDYSEISGCYVENCTIIKNGTDSWYYNLGGLIGYCYSGKVNKCYSKGCLVATNSENSSLGGLVGDCSGWSSMVCSYSENCSITANRDRESSVGGLIGSSGVNIIGYCYSTNVDLTGTYKGGIFGELLYGSLPITNSCYYLKDENEKINNDLVGIGAIDNYIDGEWKSIKCDSDEETKMIAATVAEFTDDTVLNGLNKVVIDLGLTEKIFENNEIVGDSREYLKLTFDELNYNINSRETLEKFRDVVNSGLITLNAKLTEDIKFNTSDTDQAKLGAWKTWGEEYANNLEKGSNKDPDSKAEPNDIWTPIGSNITPYMGTFDGNNKTISGIYCNVYNDSGNAYAGLFGYVGSDGKIENLGIKNSFIRAKSSDYSGSGGGLIGSCSGTVTNSYSSGCEVVGSGDGSGSGGGL